MSEKYGADRDYFYMAYLGPGGLTGALVLPQMKVVGGGENPDGMNIASAHKFLFDRFGSVHIILYWEKVTQKRYEEFNAMAGIIMGVTPPPSGTKKGHLSLVSMEEKKSE